MNKRKRKQDEGYCQGEQRYDQITSSLRTMNYGRSSNRNFQNNRKVLIGIIFVLKTGIPWEYLPPEMGCGSGMTCW